MILGFVAMIRAVLHDRFAMHWGLLALVMLGLSLDEAAGIHEAGAHVLKSAGFGGEWVMLGGLFAVAVAVFFLRFLLACRGRSPCSSWLRAPSCWHGR